MGAAALPTLMGVMLVETMDTVAGVADKNGGW